MDAYKPATGRRAGGTTFDVKREVLAAMNEDGAPMPQRVAALKARTVGGVKGLASKLRVDVDVGLTKTEAARGGGTGFDPRRRAFGSNLFEEAPVDGFCASRRERERERERERWRRNEGHRRPTAV